MTVTKQAIRTFMRLGLDKHRLANILLLWMPTRRTNEAWVMRTPDRALS